MKSLGWTSQHNIPRILKVKALSTQEFVEVLQGVVGDIETVVADTHRRAEQAIKETPLL